MCFGQSFVSNKANIYLKSFSTKISKPIIQVLLFFCIANFYCSCLKFDYCFVATQFANVQYVCLILVGPFPSL